MIIANDYQRNDAIEKIMSWTLRKPMELIAQAYTPSRSAAQNKLLNKWYTEIGNQSGNGFNYERSFYKFTYGCPILVRDNTDFAEFYSELVSNFDYEMCLKSIYFIQVSSKMNVRQFTEYLNHIELNAAERGLYLTKPDEYKQAMGIK